MFMADQMYSSFMIIVTTASRKYIPNPSDKVIKFTLNGLSEALLKIRCYIR